MQKNGDIEEKKIWADCAKWKIEPELFYKMAKYRHRGVNLGTFSSRCKYVRLVLNKEQIRAILGAGPESNQTTLVRLHKTRILPPKQLAITHKLGYLE